jgi:hypothetical protein
VGAAHGGRVAPCRTADLDVWITHTGAALGTVGGYLAFTNRSPAACTLRGWPTLTAFRAGAAATAAHVHETMFGPYTYVRGVPRYVRGVPTVLLHRGQTAVAAFTAGDHGPGASGSCPPPFQHLRVAAPGDAAAVVLSAWIGWYSQDLPDCTRISLSMVVPSSSLPPRQ